MAIIFIKVPHQSKPEFDVFESKDEFIQIMRSDSDKDLNGFDEAIEYYTHDLNTHIMIENQNELMEAIQYPEGRHRWAEIRTLAKTIKEDYWIDLKAKAGRKSVPVGEKSQKVMVTLAPILAKHLRTKTNASAYVADLIKKDMENGK
jgi:hemerythrin